MKSLIVTQGTIEQASPFSLGTRYELGDPSGSIILLVWNDTIDPQQQERLAVGATLSVTGQIDEFNNQLEIVPRSPDDVVVLAAPAVTPEPTATSAPAATATPTATIEATAPAEPAQAPAATSTPEPTEAPVVSGDVLPISSVTGDSVGQTVTVRGKVVDTASFFRRLQVPAGRRRRPHSTHALRQQL